MRNIPYFSIIAIAVFSLTSCFKDYEERYLFTENRIEFHDAVINSNASGRNYPLLPGVSHEAGVIEFRVNMTGLQKDYDRTINFRVVPEESTAREGVDYRLPTNGTFVIPANSSFGWVQVEILTTGSGSPRLVLELLTTDDVRAMDGYHRIGFQILYPSTPPNPDEVEVINDMTFFKNLTFGAQSNPSVGNYIDMHTGYAYIVSGADANPEKIDFIVLRSSAGTEHNILTPSSGSVTAWGGSSHIPEQWNVRNGGTLMRLPNPSNEELALFEEAESKADLIVAYEQILANIQSRPGYNSTNDGPSTRIRAVGVGDILLFRSNDRDVVSMIKVEEMVPGTAGYLKVQAKKGGEG
ncbi:protein of unknown function [Parapedobacter composti]|uniref:Uncharacterized protein n=1 Tax=Parapedobacter composti TaxID=623281 RepID=A0A1I1EE15_9SPHI|nr:DUF4843 domain-containing protein [Parapedobacter composti]SFB83200.1 protein of unknown function [Parapedobacter composti]